ncbi:MAG: hypothetical protein IK104_00650 [Clostridia bacterium]|nr:hypothetical protein [Clostridia bacterium]
MVRRRQTKLFIALGAVFVLVMVALNFSMVSPGKRIITLKSYSTPADAFYAQISSDAVPVSKDLGTVKIDDDNAVYVALTEDGNVLAAQMWVRNDRYFYPGAFQLVPADSLKNGEAPEPIESYTYGSGGKCTGALTFTLSLSEPQDASRFEKLYGAGGLGVVYLIWQTAPAES